MTQPRFAFLVLDEHPFGREMLRRILAAGFVPEVVVVEASEVAAIEREKFLARIAGHDVAPTIAAQAAERDLAVERLAAHRSGPLMELLGAVELDLLVLGGTRILRGAILDHPRDGVVNSHPGILPDCRGSASPAWSVLHDIPIGASAHLCDRGIDTGDLLLVREFPVHRGATYEDLCHGTLVLAGELMAEALVAYDEGRWNALRRPQGDSPWPTFKDAPDAVLDEVRRKLAQGTYAHYADRA